MITKAQGPNAYILELGLKSMTCAQTCLLLLGRVP